MPLAGSVCSQLRQVHPRACKLLGALAPHFRIRAAARGHRLRLRGCKRSQRGLLLLRIARHCCGVRWHERAELLLRLRSLRTICFALPIAVASGVLERGITVD